MSSPPVPPLDEDAVLSDGSVVAWPVRSAFSAATVAVLPTPLGPLRGYLAEEGLTPVRVRPRSGGLVLAHVKTADGPVGPFEEVLFYLVAHAGSGTTVGGLRWLLRGVFRGESGAYGLHPLLCIASTGAAARLREELWGIPSVTAAIRSRITDRSATVQVDTADGRDTALRMNLDTRKIRPSSAVLSTPFLLNVDGQRLRDFGGLEFEAMRRRYLPGGQVLLAATGPIADLADRLRLGASGGTGRRITPLSTLVATAGHLTLYGPRPPA